jgi:chromosome segregation ATPase
MFGTWRIWSMLGGIAIVLAVLYFLWDHTQNQAEQINALEVQVQETKRALQSTMEALQRSREDARRNAELASRLRESTAEAEQELRDFRNELSELDLDGVEDPLVLEGILNEIFNQITDDIERSTTR